MVALFSLLTGITLITGFVSAQSIPACALQCATAALANTTCTSLTDLTCVCNNESFFDDAGACTIRSCPPDVVQQAQEALAGICKGYATTTFSLDTSTISYTGSVSGSTESTHTSGSGTTTTPSSSGSHGSSTSSHTGTTTSTGTTSPTSTTSPASTTSRGAADRRLNILGSVAGVGTGGVMVALGVVAGAFVLAL